METKRLRFRPYLPVTALEESGEIEVPEGESHFHLLQKDGSERQYVFHLRQPGSRLLLTGQVVSRAEESPELSTAVVHHAPRTEAETLVRTVAFDNSQPHYRGLIRIEKSGQDSQSFLNHHALLLGEAAKSWTWPSLEILADQVKCSHAATIRTLTDLDLFYPRSRGLGEEATRDLLLEAFLKDVMFAPLTFP